jgi:hypothetical protein
VPKYVPEITTGAERKLFYLIMLSSAKIVIRGSLSPQHGTSSGGGRRDGLHMRVAAKVLNKQSRTDDEGWSSSLGVGRDAEIPHRKNVTMLRNIQKNNGIRLILRYNLSNGKEV